MIKLKNKYPVFVVLALLCCVFMTFDSVKAADDTQDEQLQLTGVEPSNGMEVVWVEKKDNQYSLYRSEYKNSAWQSKQLAYTSNTLITTPCLGGNSTAGNILVWSVKSETTTDLYYSLYKDGAWSSPKKIETGLVSNLSPSLAVDANNRIWLAWSGSDGGLDDIYFSRLTGSVWESPARVNEVNATPDLFPVLGIGSDGYPWIQWNGYEGGKFKQFRKKWNGGSWEDKQEMTERAVIKAGMSLTVVSQGQGEAASASAVTEDGNSNSSVSLPSFLPKPERAVLHIPGGHNGIQSLPLRDLYNTQ
jgi:hypothetical protein